MRLAIGFVLALTSEVQAEPLVRLGDAWRFFLGSEAPSSPAHRWREPDFPDAPWLTGVCAFSTTTGADATPLPVGMTNWLTVYFRNHFTVTNAAAIRWLILRVDYDDGLVAYLNGQEIARRGWPALEPVAFDTPAPPGPRVYGEEFLLPAPGDLLVTGHNVLAVEVHKSSVSDYGIAFAAELLANFNRGPAIENASADQVQITWKTPVPAHSSVEYGIEALDHLGLGPPEPSTNHVVTLANLRPGTRYQYRVSSTAADETVCSEPTSFRTLSDSGPISFVALGDTGTGSLAQQQVARVVHALAPDLVLHVGDVLYPSFEPVWLDSRCFSLYGPHLRTTPYYWTYGNHDLFTGDAAWLAAFHLPSNELTGTEHFYSFDHGDAHFCALFVPWRSQEIAFAPYALTDGSPQMTWLTNDLARTTKPWKILFFHATVNSSGLHRFDYYASLYDRLERQRLLLPVAERYGVQLILTGHDHLYERLAPMNGAHIVVTGGGGASLYGLNSLGERDPASLRFRSVHHCVRVTIEGDTLSLQAVDAQGTVFDTLQIQRALPVHTPYTAAWHAPVLPIGPANDGDGNVHGQRFELLGPSIPTCPGRFSSLGQFYVNHDRDWLYLGFEQVQLYPHQTVLLFIESPRVAGATNLIGLGNDVVDPTIQGADGLDFLHNLSFRDFAPSLACMLGDECADGQFRDFQRPGAALNTGQGVFRLTPELPDVPGCRLQQFNNSPQTWLDPYEQNADFIMTAIPLRELGGVQPGDTIRVGAVVTGLACLTNVAPFARELDTSYLGRSLTGFGLAPVVLEGLPVRLAPDPDPDQDGLESAHELALGTDPHRPDTDGDGLLDGWEVEHALDPLSAIGAAGAEGDPDEDGLTNLQEQWAGTHPQDASSLLWLHVESSGANRLRFWWNAVVGRTYLLEFQQELRLGQGSQWAVAKNFPRIATSTQETHELEAFSPGSEHSFYRLRLDPWSDHGKPFSRSALLPLRPHHGGVRLGFPARK